MQSALNRTVKLIDWVSRDSMSKPLPVSISRKMANASNSPSQMQFAAQPGTILLFVI